MTAKLKAGSTRMDEAIAFVTANPGVATRMVIAHVLETFEESRRERPTAYKQAASVVDRIIRDRHVCQHPNQTLHPWDAKRKAHAEALERARHTATDPAERATLTQLACKAWRAAGDENRARTIFLLDGASPQTPPQRSEPEARFATSGPKPDL